MTAAAIGWVAWPVGAMMACGLAVFLLAGRLPPRALGALGLLTVLVGFFLLFLLLVPLAPAGGALPALIFFGSLAVFKLMNRFESPR